MTVNRNYLPFKAAREYQDRKMAKWMGFFLSEHSTALASHSDAIDFSQALPLAEKTRLLGQAHVNNLLVHFTLLMNHQLTTITGRITHLSPVQIGVQSQTTYHNLTLETIFTLALVEEDDDE